jgi:putative transposase
LQSAAIRRHFLRKLASIEQRGQARYKALNVQSAQVTLGRLWRVRCLLPARQNLYDRLSGFGFKHHGDGVRFTPGKGWKHGKLRLSGVGSIQVSSPVAIFT